MLGLSLLLEHIVLVCFARLRCFCWFNVCLLVFAGLGTVFGCLWFIVFVIVCDSLRVGLTLVVWVDWLCFCC